jgi:hypothetical protein
MTVAFKPETSGVIVVTISFFLAGATVVFVFGTSRFQLLLGLPSLDPLLVIAALFQPFQTGTFLIAKEVDDGHLLHATFKRMSPAIHLQSDTLPFVDRLEIRDSRVERCADERVQAGDIYVVIYNRAIILWDDLDDAAD